MTNAAPLLLGIDIGTSAAKALLIDGLGQVLATGSAEYEVSRPRDGWSEQDPEDWYLGAASAARAAIRAVPGSEGRVAAIGLSGQMHGAVLLPAAAKSGDPLARPLRPAILWNDQRTARQCERIETLVGGRPALVEIAGNRAMTGFTLPKLLWVAEHEPEIWSRTGLLLLPKDYVRWRLTGRAALDAGDASGVLLLDVDRRVWSDRLCKACEIDPALLPPVVESAASAGVLSAQGASALGLPTGTPVVAGSGDNQAGAVGAGVVEPGVGLITLGTSGVVYVHADRPRRDPQGRLHTMAAATGTAHARGGWCVTGVTLSAGGSVRWARDMLMPGQSFEAFSELAALAPRGAGGVSFLPQLTGERCPHADPLARGAWVGLTARAERSHLARAVFEGICLTLGQIAGLVRQSGVPLDRVRVGGGGARSPLWLAILADVLGLPVITTNTEEGPALGAALLAGVGIGHWPDVPAACRQAVRETGIVRPDPPGQAFYARLSAIYEPLAGGLSSYHHAVAAGV